jgi:HAE1 family hydrophobic/amphiphilic exporter-1
VEALARLAVRRPVAVSVFAAAVSVLGWVAWSNLPLDLLPDIHSPTIVVSVRSGDRPPAEMERLYAEQIEERLFTVRGIRRVQQVARTGRIVASVVFDWDADMDLALVDVEKAVGSIRSDPDVDGVLVRRFDPRQAPVLTVGLVAPSGQPDLAELRRIAERQVATALERLEGVAEVRVLGGREREVQVHVDRYRLDAHGLTLGALGERLVAANVDIGAGTLEEAGRVYLIRGISRFRRPEDVAAVVLKYERDGTGRTVPVRVRDVGRVVLADADITHLVRVGGVEGVGLSVYKEADSNTVAVSRGIRQALEGIREDLPGVDVRFVADEAALVEDAIRDLEGAALLGIGLAVLVLVGFLRSAGPTLVVATAVPVSLLATLFLMRFAGHTLNLMTLGGLALGAGMLVDNAIVVVESIFTEFGAGRGPAQAAVRGTGRVGGAVAASTLTTCAVFLPVLFVQGLAARLVHGLSFAVVVSLMVSLAAAILIVPALSGWLLPRAGARAVDPGTSRVERLVVSLLPRSWLVVGISTGLAAGAVWLLVGLGTELLPPSDPRQFSVRLVGPPGQRVEATASAVETVEAILGEAAGTDLVAVQSEVGRLPEDDRLIREEQSEENTARVLVRLRARGRTGSQVVAAAAPAIERLAGLEAAWEVGTSALARALGTSGPPIEVELAGSSLEDLRAAAARVRDSLARSPALWNVRSSFEGGPPEIRVVLDRPLADGLGVDLDLVAATLQAALDGRRVTALSTGDEEQDVVLRLPRMRPEELLELTLTTPSGARVALADVARLVPESGAREIFRRDQRRVSTVTARIAPRSDYPAAVAAARRALAATDLPPGTEARLAGEEQERERTFSELGFAAVLAVVLVFMVLAGTFESLIHPLTVAGAIPLSLIGVGLILGPIGRPVGVMEMLGMIVLAGVAVNDAILLVAAARGLMREGMERERALARAAALRLRPILMTTLTTVLALVPLAVGTGEAARMRSPMALTIIGGLTASTIASIVVTPCIYRALDDLSLRRRKAVGP